MTIEVQKVVTNPHLSAPSQVQRTGSVEKPQQDQQQQTDPPQTVSKPEIPRLSPEQYLDEILNMTSSFNKRLKFSINRELEQVVVKVIDSETDKVIKEIPPAELQRLHARMKETLGLLFDEKI